jgi:hypothetical protein
METDCASRRPPEHSSLPFPGRVVKGMSKIDYCLV